MTGVGTFHRDANVRRYSLAPGWVPAHESLLDEALDRALGAWDGNETERVRTYYNPTSDYAGGLLTQIPEAALAGWLCGGRRLGCDDGQRRASVRLR
jgi:hypothetical protein